jgi:hypothetical protein
LIEKENTFIDKVNNLEIYLINITDLSSNEKAQGVKFYYKTVNKGITVVYESEFDKEVLSKLIGSIKLVQLKTAKNPTSELYLKFKSMLNFEFGAYSDSKQNKWTIYLLFTKQENRALLILKDNELNNFLTILNNVYDKI